MAGIETLSRWRLYKLKLKEYANILESARIYLLDTLDLLLSDIVYLGEDLNVLLEQPGGAAWKKPEYEER